MGAAAETPPWEPTLLPPAAPPPVRQEVVDPADKEAVAWICDLLRAGRADLYGQDEADLGLLPTLARTWMRRGEQWKVPAPGTNRKCSVSASSCGSHIPALSGKAWRRTSVPRPRTSDRGVASR